MIFIRGETLKIETLFSCLGHNMFKLSWFLIYFIWPLITFQLSKRNMTNEMIHSVFFWWLLPPQKGVAILHEYLVECYLYWIFFCLLLILFGLYIIGFCLTNYKPALISMCSIGIGKFLAQQQPPPPPPFILLKAVKLYFIKCVIGTHLAAFQLGTLNESFLSLTSISGVCVLKKTN